MEHLREGESPEKARKDPYYEVLDKEKQARERRTKERQRQKVVLYG